MFGLKEDEVASNLVWVAMADMFRPYCYANCLRMMSNWEWDSNWYIEYYVLMAD